MDYTQYKDLLKERFRGSPYGRLMDWRIEDLSPGEVCMRLAWQEKFGGALSPLHCGVLASVMDSAAAAAVFSDPEKVTAPNGATVNLFISSYSQELPQGALLARARVRKRGRSIQIVSVDVEDEAGTLMASGTITYKMGASLGLAKKKGAQDA